MTVKFLLCQHFSVFSSLSRVYDLFPSETVCDIHNPLVFNTKLFENCRSVINFQRDISMQTLVLLPSSKMALRKIVNIFGFKTF